MKKIFVFTLVIVFLSSFQLGDIVPDRRTAIKIAEAVWLPIYGKKVFEERPFKVELEGDSVWIVHGSLPVSHKVKDVVYVTFGGVVYCHIRKKDGTILKVGHGK